MLVQDEYICLFKHLAFLYNENTQRSHLAFLVNINLALSTVCAIESQDFLVLSSYITSDLSINLLLPTLLVSLWKTLLYV